MSYQLSEESLARLREVIQSDTPKGFARFYEAIYNLSLPAHALKWVEDAYASRGHGKGVVIEAFYGSTKTTTMNAMEAYQIGLHPERAYLRIQEGDANARDNSASVASIIEHNVGFKLCFPNVVKDDHERGWGAAGYEVMRNDMPYEDWRRLNAQRKDPTFVGLGITSGALIGKHPDGMLLLDDIDTEENTTSDRERQGIRDILTGTVFSRISPATTWTWMIGTPWNEQDSIHYVLSTGQFEHARTPILTDGLPTWPEKFPAEAIDAARDIMGPVKFARGMLLDLEAAKGHTLKEDWLGPYPSDQIDEKLPVFMGVDYASTADALKHKERDFFAIAIMRLTPRGELVLVDGFRGQISQAEAEQKLMSVVIMYPTLQQIGVETIGKGEEYYELMMRAKVFLPLMPIPSHKGEARTKGGRFETVLAKLFQRGSLKVSNSPNPFVRSFRDEWLSWDGTQSSHDDTLDAVYMAVRAAEGHIALPTLQPQPGHNPYFGVAPKKFNPYAALGRK